MRGRDPLTVLATALGAVGVSLLSSGALVLGLSQLSAGWGLIGPGVVFGGAAILVLRIKKGGPF